MEIDIKEDLDIPANPDKGEKKDLPSFPHVHISSASIQNKSNNNKHLDDRQADKDLIKNDGEKNPQQEPLHAGSGDAFNETENVTGPDDDADINDFTLFRKD